MVTYSIEHRQQLLHRHLPGLEYGARVRNGSVLSKRRSPILILTIETMLNEARCALMFLSGCLAGLKNILRQTWLLMWPKSEYGKESKNVFAKHCLVVWKIISAS